MTELKALIREERESVLALLTAATDEQWSTESLCEGWTVENVAAHLAWAPVAGFGELVPAFFRAGLRPNRLIANTARHWSTRGRPAILDQLRHNLENDAKPFGVSRMGALLDAVVHGLDVRVPLGMSRVIDDEVFVTLADWLLQLGSPLAVSIGGRPAAKFAGYRLVVPEAHWAWGRGVERRETREDMLLLLTGRHPVDFNGLLR